MNAPIIDLVHLKKEFESHIQTTSYQTESKELPRKVDAARESHMSDLEKGRASSMETGLGQEGVILVNSL